MIKESELWSERIPYIKKLKEFYSKLSYKGINLWPVIAGEVYTYYYFTHEKKHELPKKHEKILMEIKFLFFEDKFPVRGGKNRILVSYFMPRDDHHELVKKSVSTFEDGELTWMDAYELKKKNPFIRAKFRFLDFSLFFRIWKNFKKANLKNVLGDYYFYFIARTYQSCKIIEKFQNIMRDYSPSGHIAFCSSSFAEEAILTLISKNKGIPTFTLQHGFFYKPTDSFASPIVQNENAISDYFLDWGKSSFDVQKQYVETGRILVVGNPKYAKPIKKKHSVFRPRRATIFFSVPGYNEGNLNMLKIVKEFIKNHPEIRFNITVHPMNDMNLFSKDLQFENVEFMDKSVQATTLLEESDFVILYNTTVSLEALNYGIPIFRYSGKDFLDFWNYSDKFTNLEELDNLFEKTKNKKGYEKTLNFYYREGNKHFFKDEKRLVPEIYRSKIMEIIKKWKK